MGVRKRACGGLLLRPSSGRDVRCGCGGALECGSGKSSIR
jgi:hypothetical protein